MKGLYEILEQVRHSFRPKLLESIKVHSVFYIEKLQWDLSDSLLGQVNLDSSSLELEDSETEYNEKAKTQI